MIKKLLLIITLIAPALGQAHENVSFKYESFIIGNSFESSNPSKKSSYISGNYSSFLKSTCLDIELEADPTNRTFVAEKSWSEKNSGDWYGPINVDYKIKIIKDEDSFLSIKVTISSNGTELTSSHYPINAKSEYFSLETGSIYTTNLHNGDAKDDKLEITPALAFAVCN